MVTKGIWYFEDVNLFKILCPHKFAEYKANHPFKEYKKEEFVYFKEDLSTKIFLIVEGKVKVASYTPEGKEIVKAILTKGELFGELALLGEEKREEFAQVMGSPTVLCPVTTDILQDLMRKNRDLSFRIYKLIGFRIKKLERKVASLIAKDVKTRLIEFLQELAKERGRKVGDEVLVWHQFTQKDIADLIGTSRQTVTTLLNDLKEENLIYFDRKRILIRDVNKLTQVVV
ncbi:MAG: Crp/Fnr family transcriptional regulator [Bacteroidia bacterium]|nr:Crp/Fnr family transcriptional regulator [Bacteroidia bacterium]